MKRNNLILIILVIMTLITVTVSAKPDIKKIDLDDEDQAGNVPVTVIATSDSGTVIKVITDRGELIKESDPDKWGNNINIPLSTELTIASKDSSGETSYVKAYRGSCTENYDSHREEYSFAHVEPDPISGKEVRFYLTTTVGPSGSAILGFCVYPDNPKTSLSAGPDADTPDWKWVPKFNSRYRFGFGRLHGHDNIPLDADRYLDIGTAYYKENTNSNKILMHILDPVECSKNGIQADGEDKYPNTCWRRPGTSTQIPEFPTIALPIAAVIGLVFLFQHRRNKGE